MLDSDDYPLVQSQAVKLTCLLAGVSHADGLQEVERLWDRAQANRSGHVTITDADRRLLWESTLERCLELLRAGR